MMGDKKLSTIRKEIEQAFTTANENPIKRLEREIASSKRKGEKTEILEGLKRFLELSRGPTRRKARPKSKRRTKTKLADS